jgi:hypothetical protein
LYSGCYRVFVFLSPIFIVYKTESYAGTFGIAVGVSSADIVDHFYACPFPG